MKLYIIAGEASGDLHGSNLIKALRARKSDLEIRAWGGDLMQAEGAELVKHYRELAFMGFLEVAMNLRTILGNMKMCKQDILDWKPDAIILIDYPGFNLRIAEFAHAQGIKVLYYISPQVWAWKRGRVQKIKKVVDRMFVILPFEKEFYAQYNYDVEDVGHPLLDAIGDLNDKPSIEVSGKKIIALLPGSRLQEVEKMLQVMLTMVPRFPECKFVIAAAPSLPEEALQRIVAGSDVEIRHGDTYGLLQEAHAALVTSGTATLETALFDVPEVVCYKGGQVSYLIARQLIKVEYISLVNLIMKREVVKELIQSELNEKNLHRELKNIVEDEAARARITTDYRELRTLLGGKGASQRAADAMLKTLEDSN